MASAILQIIISAVDRASGAIKSTGESTLRAQERIAKSARIAGVAMAAMGAAGLFAARSIARSFAEVETAFANVSTLLNEGEDAMDLFGDAVSRLSTELPVQGGRIEVINGLYQTLSAGITNASDATLVLEIAIKAAKAGLTDTFTAVDVITTALNAYGLSADRAEGVSDILFETVRRGKLNFDDIASTIGRVLGIAAQLNVPLEDIAAAMATLTKQGINAEEASTGLTATLTAMLTPSEALKQRLEDLGIESAALLLQEEGLAGAIKILTAGLEEDTIAMAELFPNVRALRTVLPLAGKAAETFAADLDAMKKSAGAAGKAFAKAADTTSSRMAIMKNRIDAAVESIGEGATPAMENLTGVVASAAEGLAWFNQKTGGAIGAVLTYGSAMLSAIGPMVAMIAQIKLMSIARSLQTIATGQATVAQHGLNFAMLASPLGIIIIAIIAIIAVIILLITHWDQVRAAMEKVWNFIKTFMFPVLGLLIDNWDTIIGVMSKLWEFIKLLFMPILLLFTGRWGQLGGAMQDIVDFIAGVFQPILEGLAQIPQLIIDAFFGLITFYVDLWKTIFEVFLNAGKFFLDIGGKLIQWLIDGVKGIFGRLVNLGMDIMKAILDGMMKFLEGAGDFFGDIGDAIAGFFTGSPQLKPRIAVKFELIGSEMSKALTEGFRITGERGAEIAARRVSEAAGRVGAVAPLGVGGGGVTIHIGSIIASGAEEGREAADALMRELQRRGLRLGLGT